jgi:hypothetical protein
MTITEDDSRVIVLQFLGQMNTAAAAAALAAPHRLPAMASPTIEANSSKG